jgi:hypothetical protein
MTPLGIEPTTFRLVVQCLNQLRYHVPLYEIGSEGNVLENPWFSRFARQYKE